MDGRTDGQTLGRHLIIQIHIIPELGTTRCEPRKEERADVLFSRLMKARTVGGREKNSLHTRSDAGPELRLVTIKKKRRYGWDE